MQTLFISHHLEFWVGGVADERERDALGGVDEGADPRHALEGQLAVRLRATGHRVGHDVHLGML